MSREESKFEWIDLGNGRKIMQKKAKFRFVPNHYGDAPIVIFDSMPPTYHEAGKRIIDSRADWRDTDKACGTMTVGSVAELDDAPPTDNKEARRYDIMQARKRAVAAVKNNTHPFTDDEKTLMKKQDEIISQKLGYNVSKIWEPKTKKLRKMGQKSTAHMGKKAK